MTEPLDYIKDITFELRDQYAMVNITPNFES